MERHLDLLGKKRSRASQDGWVGPQGVVTSNELTEAELIEERVQERLQQARSELEGATLPSPKLTIKRMVQQVRLPFRAPVIPATCVCFNDLRKTCPLIPAPHRESTVVCISIGTTSQAFAQGESTPEISRC
jgi:hypothetical protein